jgi:flagellar basal-body rod protein FlgF
MIQGLYITATGMLAQEQRHDIVAQNLANVSTVGYQRQTLAFHAEVAAQFATGARALKGQAPLPLFQVGAVAGSDRAQANTIRETGNPTNLALEGAGFFTVETPQGPAYTRNGDFTLDASGRLTTRDGLPVLGENGPITITSSQWRVSPDGRVTVKDAVVDRLRIATIDDLATASRIGSGLWQTADAQPAKAVTVRQGSLEGSNVSAITEMLALIQTTRQYEACQKCLQAIDGALDRAVNDVGRT